MITLESRWEEIFGTGNDIKNRNNWEAWKKIARKAGEKELVAFWSDPDACIGCKHLDKDWCTLQELPCTVNPYLTLKHGMLGMACMGMGRDDGNPQQELPFS